MNEGPPTTRSNRRTTFFVVAVALLPGLSALESLVRPAHALLVFHDILIPAMGIVTFFVLHMIFYTFRMIWLAYYLLAVAALVVVYHRKTWQVLVTGRRWLARACLGPARAFAAFLFLGGWLFWCAWQAEWAVVVAAAGLLVFRRRRPTKHHAPWSSQFLFYLLTAAGSLAFVLFNLAHLKAAPIASAERWLTEAAYDVERRDDGVSVLLSRSRGGIAWQDLYPTPITGTHGPQRLALDRDTGVFYLANYLAERRRVITRYDGRQWMHYDLPECRRAIDVAYDRDRLLVACESSYNLVLAHLPNAQPRKVFSWNAFVMPYGVAVDHQRQRAYATSEIGPLFAVDLATETLARKRLIGIGTWGITVDEATGHVFVARFIAGEIDVLDEDLRIIKRLRVDCAPRDLAIDAARRLLLAGNYVTGTVSVIGLDDLRVRRTIRLGDVLSAKRLRGVSVGPSGEWLISSMDGVVAVAADAVDNVLR